MEAVLLKKSTVSILLDNLVVYPNYAVHSIAPKTGYNAPISPLCRQVAVDMFRDAGVPCIYFHSGYYD